MMRYLITLLIFTGLILAASAQSGSRKYEDFKCDYNWMYTQSNLWNSGRSHLNWFKRCIEFENLDVNDQSASSGRTALHTAAILGEIDTIRYLISKGANIETFDFAMGYTALHFAVEHQKSGAVQILVDSGANVSAKTPERCISDPIMRHPCGNWDSTLHLSVNRLDLIVTRILIGKGAQVNSTDYELNTPLHRLLLPNFDSGEDKNKFKTKFLIAEICETLINAGAEVRAKNFNGESPLDLARQHLIDKTADREDCAEIVLSKVG